MSATPTVGTTQATVVRALRAGSIAAVVQFVINLVAFPFIIRYVGAGLFGAWTAIASLLAIGALADAGVRTEITRRVGAALGAGDRTELQNSLRSGVGILAVTASCLGVLGIALAPLFRGFVFPGGVAGYTSSQLDLLLRVTILLLAVMLVVDGHLATLRGVQRADVEALSVMVGFVAGAGTMIGLAAAGLGLWALFLGAMAQYLVRWTIQFSILHRLMPELGFGATWPGAAAVRGYLTLSSLVLLSQLGDVIDSQWDKIVLARFLGPSSVAFFAAGTLLVTQAKAVIVIPLSPILAATSELHQRDQAALDRAYSLLSATASVVSTVLLTGAFVLGPAFVRLWLGPDFSLAGVAVRFFAVAVAINLMNAAASFRCIGVGWHRLVAASALTNILVNGVLSFILAARIGFNGPLIGSIVGNASGVALFQVLLWRRTRASWTVPRYRGIIAAIAVSAAVMLFGFDHPTTWPTLAATALTAGLILAAVTAIAERLSIRALVSAPR